MHICTRVLVLSLALIGIHLPAAAEAQRTLVHAGRLFDGTADRLVRERTVVIEGNRISAVQRGYTAPEDGDRVIDLRGHTVLPGLIDMHVHLDHQLSPQAYAEKFRLAEADFALRGAHNARLTLESGFTTVRDLGGRHDWAVPVALRRNIAAGYIPGPRVFAAGKSLATTGGHGDPTNDIRLMGQVEFVMQDGDVVRAP